MPAEIFAPGFHFWKAGEGWLPARQRAGRAARSPTAGWGCAAGCAAAGSPTSVRFFTGVSNIAWILAEVMFSLRRF